MTEREQRLVFGEVAEVYDRARSGYPRALVDDVLAFAGPEDDTRVLEIGAGTGKATVLFAARPLSLVAIEPDPRMAEVARRNCLRFANVTIEEAPFPPNFSPVPYFRRFARPRRPRQRPTSYAARGCSRRSSRGATTEARAVRPPAGSIC